MDGSENKSPKLTSAFDLFSKSSALVQANISTFAILYLPTLLTSLASRSRSSKSSFGEEFSGFNISGVPTALTASQIGFGVLLLIVFVVINVITYIMLYVLNLEVSEGKKPKMSKLWAITKKFGPRLIGLQIAAIFIVLGGLILFIVPGLIFIRRYFLASYVMLDKDVSIGEALKMSADMSKPYSASIWGIIGVSILIGLVGIVPFIGWIISFVLAALYSVAPALRYQEIKALHETKKSSNDMAAVAAA